jgi:excisionase family DNA binding protein
MATVHQLHTAGTGPVPVAATYTVGQAAARLGISESTARRLIRTNQFPCVVLRLGRRVVVPIAALEALLSRM